MSQNFVAPLLIILLGVSGIQCIVIENPFGGLLTAKENGPKRVNELSFFREKVGNLVCGEGFFSYDCSNFSPEVIHCFRHQHPNIDKWECSVKDMPSNYGFGKVKITCDTVYDKSLSTKFIVYESCNLRYTLKKLDENIEDNLFQQFYHLHLTISTLGLAILTLSFIRYNGSSKEMIAQLQDAAANEKDCKLKTIKLSASSAAFQISKKSSTDMTDEILRFEEWERKILSVGDNNSSDLLDVDFFMWGCKSNKCTTKIYEVFSAPDLSDEEGTIRSQSSTIPTVSGISVPCQIDTLKELNAIITLNDNNNNKDSELIKVECKPRIKPRSRIPVLGGKKKAV